MFLALAFFAQASTDSLVEVVHGDLPIVITAPHGGTQEIPGGERGDTGAKHFVTVTDTRTDLLARTTGQEVEKLFGKKPWVVIAQFSRKYLDVNRPIETGAESDASKALYKVYHEAVRKTVDDVRARFGKGLLIDIHGQGSAPKTVFRGTQNLKTVDGLTDEQLSGPSSLLGVLEKQGIQISPGSANAKDPENPRLDGGYTVQTYGRIRDDGLFAFQLEFGSTYRTKDRIPDTAKALAAALKSHYDAFMKP